MPWKMTVIQTELNKLRFKLQKKLLFLSSFIFFHFISYIFGGPRKVVWEELDFKIIKTEHFNIYYPVHNPNLGKIAGIFAEEAALYISKKLNHHLSQPISIIVYPSHNHFQSTNVIPVNIGEATGGFTESLRNRVVIPYMGSLTEFRHVISHEIVHAFQFDILYGETYGGSFALPYRPQPPLWVMEGLAEYLSVGWDESGEITIREALLSDTLPSIQNLSSYRVQNGYMYYKAGQSIMWFIDSEYGSYKLGEFLKDIRDQNNLQNAIQTNFGMSIDEFNDRWILWLKRKYCTDITRKNAIEDASFLTNHQKETGYVSLHPAISPDGKNTAFISIRNFYPVVVIRNTSSVKKSKDYSLSKKNKNKEKIILKAGNNPEFEGLHLLDNRISFSKDGKHIALTVTSQGRDSLILYDIEEQKIVQKIIPPVESIRRPYMTQNKKWIVFSGMIAGKSDIYITNIETEKTFFLTNDRFEDDWPVLSENGKHLIFSSNRNKVNNYENRDMDLYQIHLSMNSLQKPIPISKPEKILSLKGSQKNPNFYYSKNSNRLIFLSNHEGPYNLYLKDQDDDNIFRITNYYSDLSGFSMDQKAETIALNYYHHQSYDIILRKAPVNPEDVVKSDDKSFKNLTYVNYPNFLPFPGGPQSFEFTDYKNGFRPDWIFFGMQYSNYYGFGGFLQTALTDNLGNQKISFYMDFLSKRENINFTIDYTYLKKRIDFHVGAFKASNYYSIFNFADLASINNLFYNPNFLSYDIHRFGLYAQADYPINPFLIFSLQWEFSRYEQKFFTDIPENYLRKDISTNIHAANMGLAWNNVTYSYMGPLSGTYFQWIGEQTMNLTGHDYIYHRQSIDFRHYSFFWKRFVYAFRFYAASINGPQADYFPFQIGGYNSIRSFSFLSISGRHTLLMKNEIRFPFLDAIVMGFPSRWFLPGFSGVFFIDMGTAFNDHHIWDLYDEDDHSLKDLKVSYGLGARLVLLPGLIMKIDWGTPYDLRRSLRMSKWQGVFSIGYEY